MYYSCKNCVKSGTCFKPMRFKFGFCETDFEPIPKKPVGSDGMKWTQISSNEWEARGKFGVFNVKRAKGKWWAHYASADTAFKMPPKGKLIEAKEMCEDNANWETAV